MVHFDSVAKEYGDVRALDDATFTIERGGIVGLLDRMVRARLPPCG